VSRAEGGRVRGRMGMGLGHRMDNGCGDRHFGHGGFKIEVLLIGNGTYECNEMRQARLGVIVPRCLFL